MLVSILAITGPVVIGFSGENIGLGLLASFGALIISGTNSTIGGFRQRTLSLIYTMLMTTAAVFLGGLIGGMDWVTGGFIILLCFIAALVGGMSRFAAQASTQFIIFLIIGISLGESNPYLNHFELALIFAGGGIWGIVVSVILLHFSSRKKHCQVTPTKVIPFLYLWKRWKGTLRTFTGWQYSIRMALCMAAAEVIGIFLHQEKSYWIALTVALVLRWDFNLAFSRIMERGIGTLLGVFLGSLLLLGSLSPLITVLFVGILATLRPIFKNRSYALYSALMTPYIFLLVSMGEQVTTALLFQRFFDTLIGCVISLFIGYLIWTTREGR